MKKIFVLLVALVVLYSCFYNKKDVEEAKDEILNDNYVEENFETWDFEDSYQDESLTWTADEENDVDLSWNQEGVFINSITPENEALIEIEDLSWLNLYSWEFYIRWKTLKKVDKIIVNFSNDTSTYPPDTYTLKEYKTWDETFRYLASDSFKTLDYGLNTYIFSAYAWEEVYKVKVEINIPKKQSEEDAETQTWSEISVNQSSWDITMQKKDVSEIKCDWLTDYLVKNYWFVYWSQCRDLTKDKSIWYFVLRLKWENYFFEKHYVDYDKWEYWVLPLASWSWVTKDNISEKIQEFANQSWEKVSETDKLFKWN